jgi:hypothetical protein
MKSDRFNDIAIVELASQAFGKYLSDRGMELGIYTDAGPYTCQGCPVSGPFLFDVGSHLASAQNRGSGSLPPWRFKLVAHVRKLTTGTATAQGEWSHGSRPPQDTRSRT